ncbi:MAG: T9SS type A sorting domain-containing protein [Bacteroidetes bacterium]|nr:T9SS type A sorting domain-containing protein [Bacteroidota bacterium]
MVLEVTLSISPAAATIVSNSLTMTSGVLYTDSTNILRILDNATSTSGSANSYIRGPVVKVGNDDFVFPIGKAGKWRRVGISSITDVSTEVKAEYFNTGYTSLIPLSGRLQDVDGDQYWDIDRTVSTDSMKIELFWESISQPDGWICDELTIAHWKTNHWAEEVATTVLGSLCDFGGSGSLKTTGYVSSFSPFSIGGTGQHSMPIELLSFEAKPVDKNVQTRWTTSLEVNNHYFTLERSPDAETFTAIARIEGANNSTQLLDYNWLDENPLPGVSYYRLKQTDYDGQFSYSNIVSVRMKTGLTYKIYPNPSKGHIYIYVSDPSQDLNFSMIDMTGREVFSKTMTGNNGQLLEINTSGILPAGMYFIHLSNGADNFSEKLIVE